MSKQAKIEETAKNVRSALKAVFSMLLVAAMLFAAMKFYDYLVQRDYERALEEMATRQHVDIRGMSPANDSRSHGGQVPTTTDVPLA